MEGNLPSKACRLNSLNPDEYFVEIENHLVSYAHKHTISGYSVIGENNSISNKTKNAQRQEYWSIIGFCNRYKTDRTNELKKSNNVSWDD